MIRLGHRKMFLAQLFDSNSFTKMMAGPLILAPCFLGGYPEARLSNN